MEQKRIAIPLPHEESEWVASTLTPAFDARMRQHGFTTLRTKKIASATTSIMSCQCVMVSRLPLAGDLDVVAFLDDLVLLVECKSYSEVEQGHFSRFLQRVHAFHPTLAIMLIDTPSPFAHERLALFNAALQSLGYAPLRGSRGFYWGA